jgi:hypothetical protein
VGSPLPREDRFDVQNDGRILQIRYVKEKDRGVYTCRAINDVATIEASAELIILTQCKSSINVYIRVEKDTVIMWSKVMIVELLMM